MEFYNSKKEYVNGLDLVYSVSVYPAISLIAFYYTHYHVWTLLNLYYIGVGAVALAASVKLGWHHRYDMYQKQEWS